MFIFEVEMWAGRLRRKMFRKINFFGNWLKAFQMFQKQMS